MIICNVYYIIINNSDVLYIRTVAITSHFYCEFFQGIFKFKIIK